MTDEEWEQFAPLMPKPGAASAEVDFREVINAGATWSVRGAAGGCCRSTWGRGRPVYGWFREPARRFLFQTIHDVVLMLDRERAGHDACPSAAVIDSQSVKAPQAKTSGYDTGKEIVGRKRHTAVDTDGRC